MHGTSLESSERQIAADPVVAATTTDRCEANPRAPHFVVRVDDSLKGGYGHYGLRQLLRAAGLRVAYDHCAEPAIYYGSNADVGRTAALWIPASDGGPTGIAAEHSRGKQRSHPHVPLSELEGVAVLHDGHPPSRLIVGNRMTFDIARATAFWLTLASEQHATERDEHGRIPAQASLLATGDWLHRPPVQRYADLVVERLMPFLPAGERRSRWPHGKTYAVALTHDVDDPERPSRLPGLAWRYLRGGGTRRRETYWQMAAEIRVRGMGDAVSVRPTKRRAWDFGEFCRIERQLAMRSAFYFATVGRREGHTFDVCYEVSRARYRKIISRLESDGWEVGLHAAYLTRAGEPAVKLQLERLDRLTNAPVVGVRHHYLQLDPDHPMGSLAEHAASGLCYDTSIGFNDCPGFRAGTALPYQPLIPTAPAATSGSFLELPMSLADMHLEGLGEEEAVDIVIRHMEAVRGLGGLALLNWHVGRWHSDPTWRAAYQAVCRFLSADDSVWVALPRDIVAWWLTANECAAYRSPGPVVGAGPSAR